MAADLGGSGGRHPAVAILDGRQHQLGSYRHKAMGDMAHDMALLLHAHFAAAAARQAGGDSAAQVPTPQLRCLEAEAYQERQEWEQLTGCASLEEALAQLVESDVAQQLYYEAFAGGSSEDEGEGGGKAEGGTTTTATATAAPARAAAAGAAGVEAHAAQAQGELGAAAPPLLPTQQPQPQPLQPSQEEVADDETQPASPAGFAASDAAAALAALASLAGTNWDEEDEDEGEGEAAAAPRPSPLDRRKAARRARPAKLWCRYPLDGSQWALVLGGSVIDSRSISLPWTNPSDMACELLGHEWVTAIRRREQSGTARETAVLLDGQYGETEVTYALYARSDPRKETRPQYIEKISPLLQRHSAVVGDVLLLLPLGGARMRATLLRADTEEAHAVHSALGFELGAEQETWRRKRVAAHTRHPPKAPVLRRQSQQLPAQHPQHHQQQQQQAEDVPEPMHVDGQPGSWAPSLPGGSAGSQGHAVVAAGAAAHDAAAAALAAAAFREGKRRPTEQEAAALAVDEIMHLHKRPKWEHGHAPPSAPGSAQPSASPSPTPDAASVASAPHAAAAPGGGEAHRHPAGLNALLKGPQLSWPQQARTPAQVQQYQQYMHMLRMQQAVQAQHAMQQQAAQQQKGRQGAASSGGASVPAQAAAAAASSALPSITSGAGTATKGRQAAAPATSAQAAAVITSKVQPSLRPVQIMYQGRPTVVMMPQNAEQMRQFNAQMMQHVAKQQQAGVQQQMLEVMRHQQQQQQLAVRAAQDQRHKVALQQMDQQAQQAQQRQQQAKQQQQQAQQQQAKQQHLELQAIGDQRRQQQQQQRQQQQQQEHPNSLQQQQQRQQQQQQQGEIASPGAGAGAAPSFPTITIARPPMLVKSTSFPARGPSAGQPQPQLVVQLPAQQGKQQPGTAGAAGAAARGGRAPVVVSAPAPMLIRSQTVPSNNMQAAQAAASAAAAVPDATAAAAAAAAAEQQLGRPAAGVAPVQFTPLLVRSTTVGQQHAAAGGSATAAPLPAVKPAVGGATAAPTAARKAPGQPTLPSRGKRMIGGEQQQSARGAVPEVPSAAAAAVPAPGTPVSPVALPDASSSLARLRDSLEQFAVDVAVRVPPEQQRAANLEQRLARLASAVDGLLEQFWASGP